MAEGNCYLVCSQEYGEVDPIMDDGSGPMEYGRDVVYVRARTVRRAKVLAVRWFRRRRAKFLGWAENPFSGMLVERVDFTSEDEYDDDTHFSTPDAVEGDY